MSSTKVLPKIKIRSLVKYMFFSFKITLIEYF